MRFFQVDKLLLKMRVSSTVSARRQLSSIADIISKILSETIFKFTIISGKRTISIKEIELAVNFLAKSLAPEICSHSNEVVDIFSKADAKHCSRQEKSGISFAPSIAEKYLRQEQGFMLTKTAPIFFASVVEGICASLVKNSTKITVKELEKRLEENQSIKELLNISFTKVEKPCLPKLSFKKLIKDILDTDKKISKDAVIFLQYFVEDYLIDFLRKVNSVVLHNSRVKITPKDIELVCNLFKKI